MSIWDTEQKEQYFQEDIEKLPCIRNCGRLAHASWQICADGNNYRPICKECDIELNNLVLIWAGCPLNVRIKKMEEYIAKADEQ